MPEVTVDIEGGPGSDSGSDRFKLRLGLGPVVTVTATSSKQNAIIVMIAAATRTRRLTVLLVMVVERLGAGNRDFTVAGLGLQLYCSPPAGEMESGNDSAGRTESDSDSKKK